MNTLILFLSLITSEAKISLKGWGHEIKILDNNISKKLFNLIPEGTQEQDQHLGHLYKTGENLYCQWNSSEGHSCALYFNTRGDGTFSNHHTDPNYGKGDLLDVISQGELLEDAEIKVEDMEVSLKFGPLFSQRVLKKIGRAKEVKINSQEYAIGGKHLMCRVKKNKKPQCFARIGLEGDLPEQKMELLLTKLF